MKVIILTAKYGMGHMSASNAIKENIEKINSNAHVQVIDFYEYTMPFLSKYLYKAFSLMLKFSSKSYIKHYINGDKQQEKVDLISKKLGYSIKTLVEKECPDLLISTFPFISQGIGFYKEKYSSNIPFITCITDVSSHYEWINKETNKYLVPSESVKDEMVEKGVPSENIIIYGIPVSNKFLKVNKKLINNIEKFNSNKVVYLEEVIKQKELLIMGGGLGILPQSRDFYEKLNSFENIHTTIVTGNNNKIFDLLNGRYKNITVLGYSNNVDKLMEKADCVLTKPGGITVFESLYSITPIISFHTDLPNEIKNIEFITDNKFGINLVDSADRSIQRIKKFIENTKELSAIKDSMSKFIKSLNKKELAEYIYSIEDIGNIKVQE